MKKIEIYTDGSCNQEAKTGGWSFLMLEDGNIKIKKSGAEVETTNNQMEMMAAIKAFEELDGLKFSDKISVVIFSDSAYLVNAFNQDWISGWLKNGWLNASKKPVVNKEFWETLIVYQAKYRANFVQITRRSNAFAKQVDEMAKKPSVVIQ
jgi:ribonuclease HI